MSTFKQESSVMNSVSKSEGQQAVEAHEVCISLAGSSICISVSDFGQPADEMASNNSLLTVQDYEQAAKRVLPKNAWDYYRSGANDEQTLGENSNAFDRLRIRPRFLRDVSQKSTATTVLGHRLAAPISVAPTAMQKMAHPDGEIGNARAAGAAGVIFTLSTLSTTSIEDVAQGAPDTIKWFQLYIYKDRDLTRKLVKRAEDSGFSALVLTVDAPTWGQRNSDVRNNFKLPSHLKLGNFCDDSVSSKVGHAPEGSGLDKYVNDLFDPTLTWQDVKWLKSLTRLPIVLKGILTAEDAVIGADLGVAAIQVSNHGGRQLDGAPAAIEALVEIVRAVGDRVEVYLDGGVRKGTDVFKAVALGARTVFVGRPAVWGLSHGGEEGVRQVLEILKREFGTAMALTGCAAVQDIVKEMVVHESAYSKL